MSDIHIGGVELTFIDVFKKEAQRIKVLQDVGHLPEYDGVDISMVTKYLNQRITRMESGDERAI
ncbi:MAG: hypothetical protein EBY41_00600 [Proteobacteria bacterium]|nr:hypothetical protein [Pseudomonadota bacterium]